MDLVKSSRFKDAPWFPTENVYTIIGGAGGIGSWLTLMLARAGFNPIVWDFDVIEEHNIGGQLFPQKSVNNSKVVALRRLVKEFTDTDINVYDERYDKETMSHHYVFSAFDNMQARKDMFSNWKNYVKEWKEAGEAIKVAKDLGVSTVELELGRDAKTPIFIDGRLLMEQLTVFCVTPDKIEEYEKHLFDDSEVAEEPCTLKQTSHTAAMIASYMTSFFTNHFANTQTGENDRNIPFK